MTDKDRRDIQNSFSEGLGPAIAAAFFEKFKIKVETSWSIIAMVKVTTREDGVDFTQEQYDWIGTFTAGYEAAKRAIDGYCYGRKK